MAKEQSNLVPIDEADEGQTEEAQVPVKEHEEPKQIAIKVPIKPPRLQQSPASAKQEISLSSSPDKPSRPQTPSPPSAESSLSTESEGRSKVAETSSFLDDSIESESPKKSSFGKRIKSALGARKSKFLMRRDQHDTHELQKTLKHDAKKIKKTFEDGSYALVNHPFASSGLLKEFHAKEEPFKKRILALLKVRSLAVADQKEVLSEEMRKLQVLEHKLAIVQRDLDDYNTMKHLAYKRKVLSYEMYDIPKRQLEIIYYQNELEKCAKKMQEIKDKLSSNNRYVTATKNV